MKKSVILPFLFSIILFGCSNSSNTIPNNIDKDLWNNSVEYVTILENNIQNLSSPTTKDEQFFQRYVYSLDEDYSSEEMTLFQDIQSLHVAFTGYIASVKLDDSDEKQQFLNEYIEMLNTLEKEYNIKTK